jgi:hypothetical protein
MSNYLSNTLKSFIILILSNDYLQRNYPNEYKDFFFNLSYNAICLYSKTQLFYNKMKNKINLIIDSNPNLKKIINEIYKNESQIKIIEFNTNGNILLKPFINDTNLNDEKKNCDENCLYLFLDINNNNTNYITTNSLVYKNDYELSNIKFLMVELVINDKKFKIDLKSENENYYIVSNILDKNFFLYFMFNYSHIFEEKIIYSEILESIDKAKLNIIDDKVNTLEVDFARNGSITILKEGYIINHISSENVK